jgi:hypothetical protein
MVALSFLLVRNPSSEDVEELAAIVQYAKLKTFSILEASTFQSCLFSWMMHRESIQR